MSAIDPMLEMEEQVLAEAARSRSALMSSALILALAMWPFPLIEMMTGALALTDKRVLGTAGLLKRRRLAVRHNQIELARVQQGLVGKLLGYGSVTIITKDDKRFTLRGVVLPHRLQREIDEAVEVAVLGRKLGDAPELTPAALKPLNPPRPLQVHRENPVKSEPKPQSAPQPQRRKPDPKAW